MGRTGRRDDSLPNCTFLTTKDAALLQAAAIIQLFREGYIEPVRPSRRASHILAHQIMALGIQLSGVAPGDYWAWLDGATCFADISADERASLVAHMLETTILANQDGRLWLGPEGEKTFGRANFRKLYAVFDTPRLIAVRWNTREIGTVDANFLESINTGPEPGTFTLAGKAWEIITIEWPRGVCAVKPAAEGRAARWSGGPRFLSHALCQAMRRVLIGEEVDPSWSQRARTSLERMRAEHLFLKEEFAPLIEGSDEITWWTFAGGAANLLLAKLIEAELGPKAVVRNTNIEFKDNAGKSGVALRAAIEKLRAEGRPSPDDAATLAPSAARSPSSKFQPCLPAPLAAELASTRLFDLPGARRVLAPEPTSPAP
jgi:ATP-dependent Lhr-like helicase